MTIVSENEKVLYVKTGKDRAAIKLSDTGDGSTLGDKIDNKVARQSADGTLEVSDFSLSSGNGCKRVNKRWEGTVKINLNENTTCLANGENSCQSAKKSAFY